MKIQWHGRNGPGGKDKGILTIRIRSSNHIVPHAHAVNRTATAFEPAPVHALPAGIPHEIKLQHGANEVDAATWAEAARQESVKRHLASGALEVVSP